VVKGQRSGASCLLSAYRSCRPAVYRLSVTPLDTVRRLSVRVVKQGHGCRVLYQESFRVIPQRPHVLSGSCQRIAAKGRAVYAVGCGAAGDLKLSA
jgi:hypothetical protein